MKTILSLCLSLLSLASFGQGYMLLDSQWRLSGQFTNFFPANSNRMAAALMLENYLLTNSVPWLVGTAPDSVLVTDAEGNWVPRALPAWFDDPEAAGIPDAPENGVAHVRVDGAWATNEWEGIASKPATFPPSTHGHPAADISDSTAAGRGLLTAADAGAQRDALGLGSASTNPASAFATSGHLHDDRYLQAAGGAVSGNVTFSGSELRLRAAPAGEQMLWVLGTLVDPETSAQVLLHRPIASLRADMDAAASNHTHVATHITDSTETGRSLLTASSQSAARSAISAEETLANRSTLLKWSESGGAPRWNSGAIPGYVQTNDVPWLYGVPEGYYLATDENGDWEAYELPAWWPNPSAGSISLNETNTFTEPQVFSAGAAFSGTVELNGTFEADTFRAQIFEIDEPIGGALIGAGISAANVDTGTLPESVIPATIARVDSPEISNLTITGTITLNDDPITSWPSGGGSGSGDLTFTLVTTNATAQPLWTNTAAADTTSMAIVDVLAAGSTNLGAFRLSSIAHARGEALTSSTNLLWAEQGSAPVAAYWTITDSRPVLTVKGTAIEYFEWKATVKLLTSLNAGLPPATFAYLFEEGFESDPNENWVLEQGDAAYYDISYDTDPLVGSASLRIISPTTGSNSSHVILRRDMAGSGTEFWGTALFRYPSSHPNIAVELLRVGSGRFTILSNGSPRIQHNTITVGSSGSTFSTNTTYRLWFYYRPSSGSGDGVFRVWRGSSSNTERNEATLLREITNGDGTAMPTSLRLRATKTVAASYASEFKWDSVKTASQQFITVP